MAVIFEDLLYTVADYIGRHEDINVDKVTVHRNRPVPQDDTEYYDVTIGSDTADFRNIGVIDWDLTVSVAIGVEAGNRDQTEQGIRQIFANREKVHKQIMDVLRNDTEGVGYILQIEPIGGGSIDDNSELASNFMVYTTDWYFKVRTNSISTLEITA